MGVGFWKNCTQGVDGCARLRDGLEIINYKLRIINYEFARFHRACHSERPEGVEESTHFQCAVQCFGAKILRLRSRWRINY